jgi:hypothetical protein
MVTIRAVPYSRIDPIAPRVPGMDISYEAGSHTLKIVARSEPRSHRRANLRTSVGARGAVRWAVEVDAVAIERSFGSRPDAWTAGVTEADRLDRDRDAGR